MQVNLKSRIFWGIYLVKTADQRSSTIPSFTHTSLVFQTRWLVWRGFQITSKLSPTVSFWITPWMNISQSIYFMLYSGHLSELHLYKDFVTFERWRVTSSSNYPLQFADWCKTLTDSQCSSFLNSVFWQLKRWKNEVWFCKMFDFPPEMMTIHRKLFSLSATGLLKYTYYRFYVKHAAQHTASYGRLFIRTE